MITQNKKHFIFVNLAIKSGYYSVNHGIAFLVPVVKREGYDVTVINLFHQISSEKFKNKILRLKPSIVGFSSTTVQLRYLIYYAKALRNIPNLLLIAGGVGPSLQPEFFLKQSDVDGVHVGEGEKNLANLLQKIDKGEDVFQTEGFCWAQNNGIIKNPVPPLTEDLSVFSFPDYKTFPREIVVRSDGQLKMMLSRGCLFKCTYCCNEALSKLYPSSKHYFRIPSVEYCISLLKKMIEDYPEVKSIDFQDDNLVANHKWFLDFAEAYREEIKLPYCILAKPESVNESMAKVLRESGCSKVNVGLESGSEIVRKNILNRPMSNEAFIKKAKLIKDGGLELFTFNIVGFPDETVEQIEETAQLNKIIDADDGVCTFFYPFPKTELYRKAKDKGILLDESKLMNITNYLTMPGLKLNKDVLKACKDIQKDLKNFFIQQHCKRLFAKHLKSKKSIFNGFYWLIVYTTSWLKWNARKFPIIYFASYYLAKLKYRSKHIFNSPK